MQLVRLQIAVVVGVVVALGVSSASSARVRERDVCSGGGPSCPALVVSLAGSSEATRPGGSVTYSVRVTNTRSRRSKAVLLRVLGKNADVVAVATRGVRCLEEAGFDLLCVARGLGPKREATVKVSVRASSPGAIEVTASGWSMRSAGAHREDVARATTRVAAADVIDDTR
jgi:hypothetical protein